MVNMVKFMRLFFLAALLSVASLVASQDIHFTNFRLAPQALNPSLNGSFLGTYRISGMYRDQYQNSEVNGFRTVEAGVDLPVIRGLRKQDWIGIGLSMNRDSRGLFDFMDTHTRMGLAYHLSLDPKQKRYISFGAQRAGVNRRMNIPTGTDLTNFQILGRGPNDPDLENLRRLAQSNTGGGGSNTPRIEKSFSNWIGGLSFTSVGVSSKTVVGLSAAHFVNSPVAFSGVYDNPLRITGFATYEGEINKKTTIEPGIFVQSMGGTTQVSANALAGYKLKQDNPMIVKAGLGYRTGTSSAQFLAGADFKGFVAGFSYDMPFTGYGRASGIQNAIEFGLTYVGIVYKKPKPKPIVVCPRL
jgi:type IX secretion system PorP/SprF family membrane protein